MFKWRGLAAVVAVMLWVAAPAGAATVITSGQVIGGWRISFPNGIALFNDGITSDGQTLVLEKVANFTDSGTDGVIEGLQIVFNQVSSGAVPFISISDENVTNNTGTPWGAFQFSLAKADFVSGSPTFLESFTDIGPFTNTDFSSNFIELNGGVVGVGETVFFGVGPNGGQLLIAANPSQNGNRLFSFKEQPIPIPLPAAAWMGLIGLAGAAYSSRRGKLA